MKTFLKIKIQRLENVASNPKTPIKIIEQLYKDKDPTVEANFASNPETPVKIIKHLSKDKDINVIINISGNTKTPKDILKLIANENKLNENSKYIEEAIENISSIHYQLLLHDELDESILEIIADSPDEWVRASIANHSNVTLNILKIIYRS